LNKRFISASLWEQGKRVENEDSIAVMNITADRHPLIMAVVADGIGGLNRGEVASSMVTYSLKTAFEQATRHYRCLNLRSLRSTMLRELYKCHLNLVSLGEREGIKLGTTLSLIVLMGKRGFLISVGDSHIYRINGEGRDNSLLTRDYVSNNRLTRCIGTGEYYRPQTKKIRIKDGMYYLLCTDGFYRRNTIELLTVDSETVSIYSMDAWLKRMHNRAVSRGEKDNSSAVIIGITGLNS